MSSSNLLTLVVLTISTLYVSSVHAVASDTALSILSSTDEIKWGPSILAIVAVAVGAIMCVAGYRLFRGAIFVSGFIIGGLLVASVIEFLFDSKSWLETASWIGFFVGGLLFGLFAMSLYSTSIFLAGAAGGVLLAFALQTSVAHKISDSHPNTVLVVMAILLGLLGGILALKLEKPVLVISTSFVGAVMVAWGVGYFAGDFPNAADLAPYQKADINGELITTIPGAWWAYLAAIIVLFVLGMGAQFGKTGRDGDYHSLNRRNNTKKSSTNAVPAYDDLQTPPTQGNPRYGNPVSHV